MVMLPLTNAFNKGVFKAIFIEGVLGGNITWQNMYICLMKVMPR